MIYILLLVLSIGVLVYYVRKKIRSPSQTKLKPSQENANLIKVLLELEDESREQLFELYQKQFGPLLLR